MKKYDSKNRIIYYKDEYVNIEHYWDYNDDGTINVHTVKESDGVIKKYDNNGKLSYMKYPDEYEEFFEFNDDGKMVYYKSLLNGEILDEKFIK